jgi:citrate lyase beta subunit
MNIGRRRWERRAIPCPGTAGDLKCRPVGERKPCGRLLFVGPNDLGTGLLEQDLHAVVIKIVPWIESAEGVATVEAICASSSRLVGASMAAEDYVTSLALMPTREGGETEYKRARVANAAMAAGLDGAMVDRPIYLRARRPRAATAARSGALIVPR